MKITQKKGIDRKLDIAWSKLVKLRAGMKCEYCLAKNKQLHSHHLYTRSKKSTRWLPDNGICLCASHHVLNSTFSAHKSPREFNEWLDQYKGEDFMLMLRLKSNHIHKWHEFEKKLLLKELNKQIDGYTITD